MTCECIQGQVLLAKRILLRRRLIGLLILYGLRQTPGSLPTLDYRTVALLLDRGAANFADACAGAFSAPKVERDLLKVPNLSLIEAVNFHAASVSGRVLTCIRFTFCFPPCGSRLCSWLGASTSRAGLGP
jgi:hypothetical protein